LGGSLFGFGASVSWDGKGQRRVVKDLVRDLEVRRALSSEIEYEHEEYLNASIIQIRDRIGEAVAELRRGSEAEVRLAVLRNACNEYLDATPNPTAVMGIRPEFEQALQVLREKFRNGLLPFARGFRGVPEAAEMAMMIPERPKALGASVLGDEIGMIHVDPPEGLK
jgi:hypothetical protein